MVGQGANHSVFVWCFYVALLCGGGGGGVLLLRVPFSKKATVTRGTASQKLGTFLSTYHSGNCDWDFQFKTGCYSP